MLIGIFRKKPTADTKIEKNMNKRRLKPNDSNKEEVRSLLKKFTICPMKYLTDFDMLL